jgi:hypothetical protein
MLKWGIRMWGSGKWCAWGLALAAPVFFVNGLRAQSAEAEDPPTAPQPQNHRVQKPMILPPMPSGPLSQLPMDQIPATPAKVTYQDGLLAISAQNTTLGEILREVRRLTGASIEIPASPGANERVVTSLGPAAPRDVLAVLLNGSSFNYVMVGSNTDPAAVSSVVLMAKPAIAGEMQTAPTVASNAYETNQMPRPMAPMPFRQPGSLQPPPQVVQPGVNAPPEAADADENKDDDQDAADDADDQAQPAQPGQADATGQPQDPNQPNEGPKTPEQILEMLRRQQQQTPPGSFPPPGQPPPGQQQQ